MTHNNTWESALLQVVSCIHPHSYFKIFPSFIFDCMVSSATIGGSPTSIWADKRRETSWRQYQLLPRTSDRRMHLPRVIQRSVRRLRRSHNGSSGITFSPNVLERHEAKGEGVIQGSNVEQRSYLMMDVAKKGLKQRVADNAEQW